MTASMTTIDLIVNLGQDVFESVTTLFKLVAFKLHCLYFSQFYLLRLFDFVIV